VACLLSHALIGASVTIDQIFEASVGAVHGLRQVEFTLLQLIARTPGINQKQLCDAVGMSAPRMTLVLDRMLDRRLIGPSPVSHDRRCRCVELTQQGHALALETHQCLLQGEAQTLPLTCGEREFLCELLHRIGRRRSEQNHALHQPHVASRFHPPEPRRLQP